MTAMAFPKMSLRPIDAARWLVPLGVFALLPKCLLCVLTYLGLAAALGLGGPEICGAAAGPASWPAMFTWAAAAAGGAILGYAAAKRTFRRLAARRT